jgi:hypothetical protein
LKELLLLRCGFGLLSLGGFDVFELVRELDIALGLADAEFEL